MVTNDFSRKARKGGLLISDLILLSTIARYVKIGGEAALMAALREVFEPLVKGSLTVELSMVVRAVRLDTALAMLAFLDFEEVRMVLLLFPSM